MKLFGNVISNGPINVPDAHSPDKFTPQLRGYTAFIGLPHWQVDARYDSRVMRDYIERGRVARSQTFVGAIKKSSESARNAGRLLLSWIAGRRRLRQAVQELSSLNERTLMDIGITRHDISNLVSGAVTIEQINARRRSLVSRPVRLISEVKGSGGQSDRSKTVKSIPSLDRAA